MKIISPSLLSANFTNIENVPHIKDDKVREYLINKMREINGTRKILDIRQFTQSL